MQVNTVTVLKNLKGEDLKDGEGHPLTMGNVIQTAALGQLRGDDALSVEEKVSLFKIAQRAEDMIADFSAKEVTRIMDRIAKAWPPLVVGRAKELLDPSEDDRKASKANGADHQPAVQ